jgi:hypothetical protein
LLVKHLDEMVSFGRLGMSVVVQNTLVYCISGLRESNELTDLLVVRQEEIIGQALHLVHLWKNCHKIDRFFQRHRRASNDQYFLKRVAFHSFVKIFSRELGQD